MLKAGLGVVSGRETLNALHLTTMLLTVSDEYVRVFSAAGYHRRSATPENLLLLCKKVKRHTDSVMEPMSAQIVELFISLYRRCRATTESEDGTQWCVVISDGISIT